MWVSLWLCQREEKEEVFSFCRKEGFEFSHSPEHTFTSGVIYCLKDETFWASPHMLHIQRLFKHVRLYSIGNILGCRSKGQWPVFFQKVKSKEYSI